MRARHARERARPLGDRPARARRTRAASTPRAACSARRRRVDGAIELDFPALAQRAVDAPPGLADVLGAPVVAAAQQRARPARRARRRTDGPRAAARLRRHRRGSTSAASSSPPAPNPTRVRLRLALRPPRRHRRGPGHRVRALRARAVLGRAPREDELLGDQASTRGGVVRCRLAATGSSSAAPRSPSGRHPDLTPLPSAITGSRCSPCRTCARSHRRPRRARSPRPCRLAASYVPHPTSATLRTDPGRHAANDRASIAPHECPTIAASPGITSARSWTCLSTLSTDPPECRRCNGSSTLNSSLNPSATPRTAPGAPGPPCNTTTKAPE